MKTLKITARARERGLNLVELMTGLAVIGILSTIAYPSFVDSLREGRRADAYSTLMFTANNLERWFSTNHTYTSDVAALGLDVEGMGDDELMAYSGNRYYLITVAPGDSGIGSSYVISARPVPGGGEESDDGCTVLTLDSTGRRTPDPRTSDCW